MCCRSHETSRRTGCRRSRSLTTTPFSAPRTRSTCSRVRKTARRRPTRNDFTCRRWACITSANSSTSSDMVRLFVTCYQFTSPCQFIFTVWVREIEEWRLLHVQAGLYKSQLELALVFSARCNIYISRLCYDVSVSVSLSVTEVHRCILANLGFKFRSKFTMHCGHGEG